jgi:hypothetical protein
MQKLKIEPATPESVAEVALYMRDRDLAEFSAVNDFDDRREAALFLAARYGSRRDVWTAGEEPSCVFGCVEAWPRVVSLLFFAKPSFRRDAPAFTRYVTGDLWPELFARGVHRIQCHSIAHYAETHGWLEKLGLRQEGVCLALGKNRETFNTFALVRPPG